VVAFNPVGKAPEKHSDGALQIISATGAHGVNPFSAWGGALVDPQKKQLGPAALLIDICWTAKNIKIT
jgi:hypothetical protein